eukprot:6192411-Pleurochrysis_carterae.AAC.3
MRCPCVQSHVDTTANQFAAVQDWHGALAVAFCIGCGAAPSFRRLQLNATSLTLVRFGRLRNRLERDPEKREDSRKTSSESRACWRCECRGVRLAR